MSSWQIHRKISETGRLLVRSPGIFVIFVWRRLVAFSSKILRCSLLFLKLYNSEISKASRGLWTRKVFIFGTVLILQCSIIYQSIMHICGVHSLQFFYRQCTLCTVCIYILQCTVKICNYLNAVIYGKQSTEPSVQI